MESKIKNVVLCLGMLVFLTAAGARLFFKSPDAYSMSERRMLKAKPEFSAENVWSGKFMSGYEEYALDQFPFRDSFRTIKAISEYDVFQKKDSNGLYRSEGHLAKVEYPRREAMQAHAAKRFNFIYETYLKDKHITPYLVIIPDKNYYLSEKDPSVLHMDYEALYHSVYDKTPDMKKIDIRDLLSLDDYYTTDTHWRQECVTDVAERILGTMNPEGELTLSGEDAKTLALPFNGVYVGQSALPVKPDVIRYLTNEELESCSVVNYDKGVPSEMSMYDFEKAGRGDGYDLYLSGALALITIENSRAATTRELVIFRDSFGSSLAPLFVESYRKVTLVDIRYIQSSMLERFLDFEDQDVLFLYSTLLLNNSLGMK